MRTGIYLGGIAYLAQKRDDEETTVGCFFCLGINIRP